MRIDGRQRRTFSATEAEAKRSLRQLLKSVDDGRPVADGNLLLSSLLDQWEAKVLPNKNIKGSTMGRHKWALNILRSDLGSTKVRTLSPERVEKALTDRAQAGYSRSSLTKLRGTLSQVLKWGVRRDLVARNVAYVVELPAEARAPKEGRSMSLGQAREFIAAAKNSPLEAMWLAMIYLGLRPGEAAGLSWPDIDFDRKTIHIWRAISRDENGAIILSEPKTAQPVRSLDAPEVVLEAFRRHRIDQKRRQPARSRRDLVEPRGAGIHLPHRAPDRPDGLSEGLQEAGGEHRSRRLDAERTPALGGFLDVRCRHAHRAGC